jgi:hypothetical protein
VIYFSTNFYKEPSCNDFGEKNSTSCDIGITDMVIQTEENIPVKDDINIYIENRPKNMKVIATW